MEEIYRKYRDAVEFFMVYIHEAHATDGWQTDSNIRDGVLFRQHQSYAEREEVATMCSLDLHITIPVLIEEMDNAIAETYGAHPERLYLIGDDGKVVHKGGVDSDFLDLEEWEQAIEAWVVS